MHASEVEDGEADGSTELAVVGGSRVAVRAKRLDRGQEVPPGSAGVPPAPRRQHVPSCLWRAAEAHSRCACPPPFCNGGAHLMLPVGHTVARRVPPFVGTAFIRSVLPRRTPSARRTPWDAAVRAFQPRPWRSGGAPATQERWGAVRRGRWVFPPRSATCERRGAVYDHQAVRWANGLRSPGRDGARPSRGQMKGHGPSWPRSRAHGGPRSVVAVMRATVSAPFLRLCM